MCEGPVMVMLREACIREHVKQVRQRDKHLLVRWTDVIRS